jgi:hypothetical protein
MNYETDITIDIKQFTKDGQVDVPRFSVYSVHTDKFMQERAVQKWADIFDALGIEYLHNVKSYFGKTEFNADFYLKQANAYFFVKGCKFADDSEHYCDKIEALALASKVKCVIGYVDKKFKVAAVHDVTTHKKDRYDYVTSETHQEAYTVHEMRHTNITMKLLNGVPVLEAAADAGHSQPSTTTNMYGHFLKKHKRVAPKLFTNIVSMPLDKSEIHIPHAQVK